jgi:ribosomal protein L37E
MSKNTLKLKEKQMTKYENLLKLYKEEKLINQSDFVLVIEYLIIKNKFKDALIVIKTAKTEHGIVLEFIFLEGLIYLMSKDFKKVNPIIKEIKTLKEVDKTFMKILRCGTCSKYNEKKTCGSCSFYKDFDKLKKVEESQLSKYFIKYLNYHIALNSNDKKRLKRYLEKLA